MENSSGFSRQVEQMELPPGFRFHPTDEELITHYLCEKVLNSSFDAIAIGEADLNKVEPWDLPSKAKMGEKEWYFFCVRDKKYPTGMRTNRATEAGYWKATGKDKEILRDKTLVGMKKTLVFYTGRAPRGGKTNWVMHEYRLEGKYSKSNLPKNAQDEWVICRVFDKSSGAKTVNDSPAIVRLDALHQGLLPSCFSPYNETQSQVRVASPTTHLTCFSTHDLVGEDDKMMMTTTPAPLIETRPQEDPTMLNPIMDENTTDFQFLDSIFMVYDGTGSPKEDFSQDAGFGCDEGLMNNHILNYGTVESSNGPINLDVMWR